MASFKTHFYPKVIKMLLLVSALGFLAFQTDKSFKSTQTKYKRVKTAYDKKWDALQKLLNDKGVNTANFEVHIRAFKAEKQLEVWCRSKGGTKYSLIKSIPVCAASGDLGPKRRQGDGQVPEGFYEVSWFNPMSDYHLGLKINYPNASDRIKAKGKDPGGDIMIHGNCVTIGCIPLEDEPIEELYVLCVESKNMKNDIAVSIYPFHMNDKNWEAVKSKGIDAERINFWTSLKPEQLHAKNKSEQGRRIPVGQLMKKNIGIFFCCLLLSKVFWGCSSDDKGEVSIPQHVIAREKFVRFLIDLTLAESAANINVHGLSGAKFDSAYAFNPLKENGLTMAQYDSTVAFYSRNPKLYKEIYEEVLTQLSDMQAKRSGAKKDTVKK
jgi:murein L,D-transpeptidase YafK